MQKFEAIPKKWGSSLGIIIPKEIAQKRNIKENEKIIVEIKKGVLAKEFFGLFKGWNKSTDELKKEMKQGWK
ncbi:AbrB/MazE/SpoVT family DNA-binding domain-containing protein [Candidatus Woesearchaeota archaeon]|nr:AbrB/MazE/SpoVT family DNA-binding domain-containing protein [Candidatus Woesearchaeota archaeon]